MIATYYIDVTQFENEVRFREKLNLLSPYRKSKIASLKQKKDKNRSLGAGIALDYALAAYGLKECSAEYELGEWGKPFLKNYPDIHFSLSHSGDYAICSIGDRPIGNDIEWVRPGRLKVADRLFTQEELDFLYAVQDEEEITQRMFRIWTMKESFLKAIGRGISFPMREFSVAGDEKHVLPGACELSAAGCAGLLLRCSFHDKEYYMKEYQAIPGYRVSVCCQESGDFAEEMKLVTGLPLPINNRAAGR